MMSKFHEVWAKATENNFSCRYILNTPHTLFTYNFLQIFHFYLSIMYVFFLYLDGLF